MSIPELPPCHLLSLPGLTPYAQALAQQYEWMHRRQAGEIPDTLILLEHPPTITLGRGTHPEDLLTPVEILRERGIVVVEADRGGEITYHAPGQIVCYPILNLHAFGCDLHRYLRDLEEVVIQTLGSWGIMGVRIPGLTGVWVGNAKIAAVGIKVSRWVTMHGFALNVDIDLTPMRRDMVPCGIADKGVTSLLEQRPLQAWAREDVEAAILTAWQSVFRVTPNAASEGILSP
jgi:lipoyl(octanoyl) transferase